MTFTLNPPLPATGLRPDYTRFHFDTSEVPDKRIVGLLACQRDPTLRTLTSRVVAARPAATVPLAQKGRDKKKKNAAGSGAATPRSTASGAATPTPAATPAPTGTVWEVELEDTVIFPEGGGQPWDTGEMVLPGGGKLVIEGSIRRQLDAVHLVRVPTLSSAGDTTPVVNSTPSDLPDLSSLIGKQVTVTVDWPRRADHMATHTAQHLLSARLDTRGLNTLSWGMPQYPSAEPAYVELSRALTWAEAQEIEAECNAFIAEERKVWIDVSVQRDGEEGAEGEANGESEFEREQRVLPKDYSGGVIRHCNIDRLDRNACCGTQCPDLSHVRFLHILPPSTRADITDVASVTQTPTRLFFVAGPRAVAHLARASRALSLAAQVVNVGRSDLSERLEKIEAGRFEAAERERGLRGEMARVVGEAGVAALETAAGAVENGGENKPDTGSGAGTGVGWVHRSEKSTHDFDFLGQAATAFSQRAENGILILTSAPVPAVSGAPTLLLVQSRGDQDGARRVYDALRAALTAVPGADAKRVKGGGARGRFMGKVDGAWGRGEAEAVERVLAAERARERV